MTQALLLIFLIWAVLLVPLGVRRRQEHPRRTVNGFEHAMDVLANEAESPTPLAARNVARRVSALQQRRLQLFLAALRGVGLTVVAAVIFGGWLWAVFAASSLLTAVYAAVLRHEKRQREYAQLVVRELGAVAQNAGGTPRKKGTDSETSRTVRLRSYRAQ